jgi:hypothetical protein
MTLKIEFPARGRGAWTDKGGALNYTGSAPGPYFRAATGSMKNIGLELAQKERSSTAYTVSIDEYAIYRGAASVQQELVRQGGAIVADGIWGSKTDAALKAWQTNKGIKADGVYGRETAITLWTPRLEKVINNRYTYMAHWKPIILDYAQATIWLESGWDVAAVGGITPADCGICQINTKAHNIPLADAFNPVKAFDFKLNIIVNNFKYAFADPILGIASYNVGGGGAESWHRNGRPDDWDAARYLRNIAKRVKHPFLVEALKDYAA